MTLPEKVKDVTQSEWLSIRERLAAAEAQAEQSAMHVTSLRGDVARMSREMADACHELAHAEEAGRMYAERSLRFSEQADQLASQLALAMAWGAEVCATVERLTAASGVTHSMVGAWLLGHPLSRSELAQWQDDMRVKAWTQTAEAEQRAERAEAERDEARKTIADARWAMANDHVESVVRAILDGVGMDAGCREEYRHDVEIARAERDALRKERDAMRACWHRDVAKGRAAIEKREADLAAARAQLAAANDQHERTMRYFHEALSFAKPRDSRAQSLLDAIEALRRGHEQRKAFNSIGPRPCDEEEIARLRAQLAAVVAAARRSYRAAGSTCECESDEHVGACLAEIDAAVALRDVLADTAQAAREHDERVRAEERERCAKACEAMVIGGRAWTAEQAKAAEVLLAAAASIRALGSR